MRKVKPAVGCYAVWDYDLYPYLNCSVVGPHPNARPNSTHKTVDDKLGVFIPAYMGYVKPKFCLGAEDGETFKAEINRLREKDRVSEQHRKRIMGDIRKRSVLGQLDPR